MLEELQDVWARLFPGKPQFAEAEYPDLTGKVYIVTGASTGIGYEASRLLLAQNAKVYMLARSEQRLRDAVAKIKQTLPDALVESLVVDFNDLATVKPGVQRLLDQETRLDGVVHNAGITTYEGDSDEPTSTKQQYNTMVSTNNLGPWLLQRLVDDIIDKTATASNDGSVRTVWVSSVGHGMAPPEGGLNWEDMHYLDTHKDASSWTVYGQTKAMNIQQAIVWSNEHQPKSGALSFSVHPGLAKTNAFGKTPWIERALITNHIAHSPKDAAMAVLYPLLSPNVTTDDAGAYYRAFDHKETARPDVVDAAEGEKGDQLVNWLDGQIAKYL